MKIGYACICIHSEQTKYRTCIQKFATKAKLQELIQHNLQVLQAILRYNVQHGIFMYRLPSSLIPFGSSPVNSLPWQYLYQSTFLAIGRYIKKHAIRVSMHPGQYTILNSPRLDVVQRAIDDLTYHACILDSMDLDTTHKLVLHIGGIYDDKRAAMQRFICVYETLADAIKKRLVIENDDRMFHIEDVLTIARLAHIPVIFDNLHHQIVYPNTKADEIDWLKQASATWSIKDGTPKIHYCEQDEKKRVGAHAHRVHTSRFMSFVARLKDCEVDIMLEVKDKNYSAIKCVQLLKGSITKEEKERYRWLSYFDKHILKYSNTYAFYNAIEDVVQKPYPLRKLQTVAVQIYMGVKEEFPDMDKKRFTKAYTDFLTNRISWTKLLERWYQFFWKQELLAYSDAVFVLFDIHEMV